MFHRTIVTAALVAIALLFASSASAQAIAQGKNEVATDFEFSSSRLTGIDTERATDYHWRISYGRFLTDRFAAGPLFAIQKDNNNAVTPYNIGGLVRFYLGDRDGRAIPFIEGSSTRGMNRPFDTNFTDVQIGAGLMFPMGRSGGRFRIAPYYYRAFFDEQTTGYSYFHSFGVSWSVGLLF